jgi:hypothetical protein
MKTASPNIAMAVVLGMLSSSPTIAQQDATISSGSDTQQVEDAQAAGADDAQALAKQLSNPIASLISVPLQSNWDWGAGPDGDGLQYRLNIQPVIPITLNDDWNLISRTIVPLVAQEDVVPSLPSQDGSQVGLGDIVQSLFFSPQKPTSGGIIWGAGPVFLLPAATSDFTGSGRWGIGPTAVALKQTGPMTFGALANHIWSVAGDKDRPGVSATFLQPFLAYTTPKATTFSVNSESTYDWKSDQWTVPINLTVAQLFKPKTLLGLSFPIQVQGGVRYYLSKPDNGPDFGVRFSVVALFPRGK